MLGAFNGYLTNNPNGYLSQTCGEPGGDGAMCGSKQMPMAFTIVPIWSAICPATNLGSTLCASYQEEGSILRTQPRICAQSPTNPCEFILTGPSTWSTGSWTGGNGGANCPSTQTQSMTLGRITFVSFGNSFTAMSQQGYSTIDIYYRNSVQNLCVLPPIPHQCCGCKCGQCGGGPVLKSMSYPSGTTNVIGTVPITDWRTANFGIRLNPVPTCPGLLATAQPVFLGFDIMAGP